MGHLWDWFLELFDDRGPTGQGPAVLLVGEIQAFSQLYKLELSTFEVVALRRLSRVYCDMFYTRTKGKSVIKNLTSPTDTEGIKSLFLRNAKRVKRNGPS